jgi:hypothetical protein
MHVGRPGKPPPFAGNVFPDAVGELRGSEERIVRSSYCPTRTDLFCSDPLWVVAVSGRGFPLSRSISPTKGGRGVQSVAAFFVWWCIRAAFSFLVAVKLVSR